MRTSTPPAYDVLLQGCYFCDLIFTGLPHIPTLGTEAFGTGFDMLPGGAFNHALALHRLGVRVGWDADFGNDLFSQFVLDRARGEGVDDRLFRLHEYPVRRISASLSFPHDRAFVSYMDEVCPPPLTPLIEQYRPRCVLLPGLDLDEAHPQVCEAAHRVGAFVYMDCQYNDTTLADEQVAASIRAVDVFSPNESEALHLTGRETVDEALADLAQLVPLVVIKRGRHGSIARRGDEVVAVPGIKVTCFDTTGAGDCFNAGFVYGYLRGEPLDACLRCGNISGALSTTARGVLTAPTEDQLLGYLRDYPA